VNLTLPAPVDTTIRAIAALLMRPAVTRRPLHALVARQTIPSRWVRWISVAETFEVRTPDGLSFTYRSIDGDVIGRRLYWAGFSGYEFETSTVFIDQIRSAKTFIDIGANTGFYTMLACAANPDCRVVAFEPVDSIMLRLREHLQMNGWLDRCELRTDLVSDFDGEAELRIPDHKVPTSASLATPELTRSSDRITTSSVVRLDSVISDHESVDFVKLDVEGFEDRVLEGMPEILKRSRPTIITECNPGGPHARVEEILRDIGYQIYYLSNDGPVPVDRIEPDRHEVHRNYLCVARD
jgi:FkbM family methyltransferase